MANIKYTTYLFAYTFLLLYGYLEKFWTGVHLEEKEEKENLKIRGCRKI